MQLAPRQQTGIACPPPLLHNANLVPSNRPCHPLTSLPVGWPFHGSVTVLCGLPPPCHPQRTTG